MESWDCERYEQRRTDRREYMIGDESATQSKAVVERVDAHRFERLSLAAETYVRK